MLSGSASSRSDRRSACLCPIRDGAGAAAIRCRESLASPVERSSYEQIAALAHRVPTAAVRSPHAARSCRRAGCGRRSSRAPASARATSRQRWQSSGSRSAHIRQMRPLRAGASAPHRPEAFEPGSEFRLPRHRLVIGNAVAIELRVARPAAERVAVRQIADALARQAAPPRFLPENHGQKRDTGVERTSATAFTPAARSIATKRSAGMLEWPMLKRSNAGMAQPC